MIYKVYKEMEGVPFRHLQMTTGSIKDAFNHADKIATKNNTVMLTQKPEHGLWTETMFAFRHEGASWVDMG